ncbi:DDE_3 domain-containing protein [Trichonephila clavipes]|nr:DDE_3 domain-containing protein [Trichonephila clavipes]
MDNNETCHRTLAVEDCLDSEGIQRLVWPERSPDLNPIENVWDALGRQVAGRNYPPTNKNILIRALTEEWDKLPQQLLDNVVQSMVNALLPDVRAAMIMNHCAINHGSASLAAGGAVGSLVVRASDSRQEVPCQNCGGGVAIYRPLGEFRRANSYCHLYGGQGLQQAYF